MTTPHGHDCVKCGRFFPCLCNCAFGVKADLCEDCFDDDPKAGAMVRLEASGDYEDGHPIDEEDV